MTDKEKLTESEDHVIVLEEEIVELKQELRDVKKELTLVRSDQKYMIDKLEEMYRAIKRMSLYL